MRIRKQSFRRSGDGKQTGTYKIIENTSSSLANVKILEVRQQPIQVISYMITHDKIVNVHFICKISSSTFYHFTKFDIYNSSSKSHGQSDSHNMCSGAKDTHHLSPIVRREVSNRYDLGMANFIVS